MREALTLKDIERAMRVLWRMDQNYARTLLGPRTRGSTTEKALFELGSDGLPCLVVSDRPIKYVGPGFDGASVYTANVPELGGRVGARALSSFDEDDYKFIRVRKGPHGPELYIEDSCEVWTLDFFRSDEVSFVVGPDGDLWTWHPGSVLDPLSGNVAVKLL